jgi:hypothetical protein
MTTTTDGTALVIDHRIGTHGTLTIRLASAELRLAATAGDRIAVRTPEGRTLPDRVIIETTDHGLSIREKDGISVSGGRGSRTIQLEIDVPAEAAIAIDTASGWLDAQGLRGEQQYRTVSGAIGLRSGAGAIDVAVVSGDVTIELAQAAALAIRSVSGDVVARGGQLDALRIQTTSGDVRLDSPLVGRSGNTIETLSGDVDLAVVGGIRVEARTLSGDLTSDLPHRSEGRMGRRTLIVGDGAIELAFRSVSGDLRIRGAAAPDATVEATPATPAAGAPTPPAAPAPAAPIDPFDAERMRILRALERGELDVATAMDVLAALDDARPGAEVGDGHD